MPDAGGLSLPPGWPAEVHPADVPGWERTALAWLFDLCPADYRGHGVLRRHPLALCHLAAAHVEAGLTALRQARSSARAALAATLDPPGLAALFEALDVEEARLLAASRGVRLVDAALRGHRYVPRL